MVIAEPQKTDYRCRKVKNALLHMRDHVLNALIFFGTSLLPRFYDISELPETQFSRLEGQDYRYRFGRVVEGVGKHLSYRLTGYNEDIGKYVVSIPVLILVWLVLF